MSTDRNLENRNGGDTLSGREAKAMLERSFARKPVGNESPLILQILHHRDDAAIAKKTVVMEADDQALFPILVALARLVAKADVEGPDLTQGPRKPD